MKHMRNPWLANSALLLMACLLFEGQYGNYRVLGRLEGDQLLEGQYSSRVLGTVRGDLIYERTSLSSVIGRIQGDIVYEGRYNTSILGHFEPNCR